MNERKKSTQKSVSLPHGIFWLAYILSILGASGFAALFWKLGNGWVWGIRMASLYLALLIFNMVTAYQDYFSQIENGVELIVHITATIMILLILLAPKTRDLYDPHRPLNQPSTFSSASNSL